MKLKQLDLVMQRIKETSVNNNVSMLELVDMLVDLASIVGVQVSEKDLNEFYTWVIDHEN